ncbi:DUF4374 domain-containing protein [Fulvivirga sediminis]|uniref:DUF4374 domain-containing protein n=1 Tax=Fulvivirga sediminis TaxID=2803949 RepID=A0A937K2M2_9BACT|nr:DUF4374 domain-containing protein [Fulvivirga sediminis]MBL3658525.1 DUF4374 domain-containing protein [Fulvivirga sediminis]
MTNFYKKLFSYGLMGALLISSFGCSDDDSDSVDPVDSDQDYTFFISASSEDSEYIVTADDLESGEVSIVGNGTELAMTGYSWIFNDDPSVAIGLVYAKGDPGIGLGYNYNDKRELSNIGQFQISSRFTSYGFFENYAITSVGGQTLVDDEGNTLVDGEGNPRQDGSVFNFIDVNTMSMETKSIPTFDVFHEGQQATFSGIVDRGDGTFLSGAVVSSPRDPDATGGSSTGEVVYPNECWVAAFDKDLNIVQKFHDDRLSYSSGRFRSQYYSQIAKDDDNNVYVFSGAYEETTTHPAGALRINNGANDFDDNYFFNIEALTDGYKFRRVWHITEDYFFLEIYNDVEPTSRGAASQYGIVKMEDQTFNWIGGDFPAYDQIDATGLPMAHDGKMYFPVTVDSEYPVVYVIDPATAKATAGITVQATGVSSVGILRK